MELFALVRELDIRTISFMVSVATFLQAAMISFQLIFHQQYGGIRAALVGNLCSAAGFLLFSLRGTLSPFLSIVVANTLIVSGASLIYVANSLFTETRYQHAAAFLPTLLVVPLLIYFTYQQDSLVARTVAVSFTCILPMGLTAKTLWLHPTEAYRKAAHLAAIPYAIYALLLFLRGLGVCLVPPHAVFEQSPIQSASFLGIFILGNLWTIGFILMINQRLHSDLNAMATTDYLTHLLNRRAMMNLLEIEAARSRRNKNPFSILLIDLDHFKGINDTYGHQVGDKVLAEVSKTFRGILRTQDRIARWGGEEFLILLPETGLEQALAVGERLRSAVASTSFATSQAGVDSKLSISVGVADTNNSDGPLEKVLSLADESLYLAKLTRNSVKSAQVQVVAEI